MNKEILIDRFENQIKTMFDTLIEIEKYEQKDPMRELSEWHKTALSMIFFNQVLLKSAWNTKLKDIPQDKALEYIEEVANMTSEHFYNLYWYKTK